MKGLGYGKDYQYAHDTDNKGADMQCLPDSLRDRVYYRPTNEGVEKRIRERLEEIKRLKQPTSDRTSNSTPTRTKRESETGFLQSYIHLHFLSVRGSALP